MAGPNNSGSFDGMGRSSQSAPRDVHFVLQKRYEVVSHLGQGGMGTVYMARDMRLANRNCVVKKLRDDFFREEDKQKALEFFKREADVLSPLKHPNIVSILDSFEEDENYYLVMEYVEGENLHQMLNQRGEPFPEEQVLQWAVQIADVLHFLHSNEPKVIYRDLKPSNVMIDTKDRVKLVDFGIARPYAEDSDNTHVVSAGYSPPEQYWGAADPRSDIYALGATMHFLLTGQEPLALQVCSPKRINPKISEPEMQQELEFVPKQQKPLKLVQAAVVGVGCLMLIGLCTFFYSKLSTSKDTTKPVIGERSSLKQKDDEIRRLREEKNKALATIRAYQTKDDTDPSQTEQPVTPPSPAPPIPVPQAIAQNQPPTATAQTPSKSKAVAFKEMDEASLTDPEGLAPLEEDSGKR
ncbi:MAG: serine/threonine protein kinase [Candidatus Melainabacteria bacterium]|nr:serine/threonine protein kinase [Candidatus Melainabacteria bacterium]